jgi:EpsI family protein
MSNLRFATVIVLLAGTVFVVRAGPEEVMPAHTSLSAFPMQVGGWQGEDIPIQPEVLEILGDGEFLFRFYRAPEKAVVDFFVAYFPTQRTGSTIHSPQNCLPGAGWTPTSNVRIPLRAEGRAPVMVNRYVVAKGDDRQVVLYWYQSNGRYVASEYWAKIYLVTDSIRRHRSDGALVRVVTPIAARETLELAEARARDFAEQVIGKLDPYIPR